MGLNEDTLKQVIGRDGYYFILTTRSCNLDFIWHNTYNNTIEFWGPNQYSLNKGMYEINKRILSKIYNQNIMFNVLYKIVYKKI